MKSCQVVGYTALCVIAIVGFATILVMVLVPDVRADLSFRSALCSILRNGIQTDNSTAKLTRAFLKVSFERDDGVRVNGTAYDTLTAAFSSTNKTLFLEQYLVGTNHSCFYDPTDSGRCTMTLDNRTMTLIFVGIAGAMMLVIPMVVCICTYVQGRRAESVEPLSSDADAYQGDAYSAPPSLGPAEWRYLASYEASVQITGGKLPMEPLGAYERAFLSQRLSG